MRAVDEPGQTSQGERPEAGSGYRPTSHRKSPDGERFHGGKTLSAIDKVYRMANLAKASRKVRANKGVPGVDGQTVAAWRANELAQLRQLHGELYADKYRSKLVRRYYIPKPGSKKMRPFRHTGGKGPYLSASGT